MTSVAVRAGALLLTYALMLVIPAARQGGANIGLGLVWFMLVIIVSACWGVLDGGREEDLLPVVKRWALVAAVLAVTTAVLAGIVEGGANVDWRVVGLDIVSAVPFMVFICLAPAVVGALIVQRRSRR